MPDGIVFDRLLRGVRRAAAAQHLEEPMTETPGAELAVREGGAVARPHNLDREVTDSWVAMMRPVLNLAAEIYQTEFVPKGLRGNAAGTTAAILYGRELGLPPMTTLGQVNVIEGKAGISAELMRALVLSAGHEIEILETTGARCEMRGQRRGSRTWTTVEWTKSMADGVQIRTKEGYRPLTSKDNWRNYPRAMLAARCTAELCRLVFPDVVHGMGAAEELLDLAGQVVDEDQAEPDARPPAPGTVQRTTRGRRARNAAQPSTAPPPPQQDQPSPPAEPAQDAPADHNPGQDTGVELLGPENGAQQTPTDAPESSSQVTEFTVPRATTAQLSLLGATWSNLGVTDPVDRREFSALLVNAPAARETTKNLTKREATKLIDRLKLIPDNAALTVLIAAEMGQDQADQGGGDNAGD